MRSRTKELIPTALLVIAATAAGVACTASSDESEGATQAALKAGGNNPPGNNGTVQDPGGRRPPRDPRQRSACRLQLPDQVPGLRLRRRERQVGARRARRPLESSVDVLNGEVDIGEDAAGGANDVDAVVVVDLTDKLGGLGDPHPKQGFHLKLTVNAPGSIGADVKHKVFWVQGCTDASRRMPASGACCGDGKEGRNRGVRRRRRRTESTGSGCSADCKMVPYCGDGCVDPGEECDLGADNGKPGKNCTADCKIPCEPPPPPPCEDGGPPPPPPCDTDGGKTW